MRSPIILSASASILANAAVELNVPDLQNPFNTAMLLDEIRIEPRRSDGAGLGAEGFGSVSNVRARFRLGREYLTADFIPCTLLARCLNPIGCISSEEIPGEELFTWRLPRPLYIPPGELLIPILYNTPQATDSGFSPPTQIVRVTYVGRSLGIDDPVPAVRSYPWAAVFNATSDIPNSRSTDLVNPFQQELFVQRFIGRGYSVLTGDEIIDSKDLMVRMTDSLGRHSVRDATPFPDLFDRSTRAWEARCVLPPKHYFLASLMGSFGNGIYFISMIGHRQVRMT